MKREKARWQYRFANFSRAYALLQEANALHSENKLDQLGKEGMIRRFKHSVDLAWNTIKDYLEDQGLALLQRTPKDVIKEAVAAKLIERGDDWMNLIDARNEMSHTYDFKRFEAVIKQTDEKYLQCFGELHEKLAEADIDANNPLTMG